MTTTPSSPERSERPLIVSDVAARLGITPWQVRRLIDSGDLVAIDVGTTGRPSWRVTRQALAEFIDSRLSSNRQRTPVPS